MTNIYSFKYYLISIIIIMTLASCTKDPVIAQVGKVEIRSSEVRKKYAQLPSIQRPYFATVEGRNLLLKNLIAEKKILLFAELSHFESKSDYFHLKETDEKILFDDFYKSLINNGKIKVSDGEISDEIKRLTAEAVILNPSDPTLRATIKGRLLSRKGFEWLESATKDIPVNVNSSLFIDLNFE